MAQGLLHAVWWGSESLLGVLMLCPFRPDADRRPSTLIFPCSVSSRTRRFPSAYEIPRIVLVRSRPARKYGSSESRTAASRNCSRVTRARRFPLGSSHGGRTVSCSQSRAFSRRAGADAPMAVCAASRGGFSGRLRTRAPPSIAAETMMSRMIRRASNLIPRTPARRARLSEKEPPSWLESPSIRAKIAAAARRSVRRRSIEVDTLSEAVM